MTYRLDYHDLYESFLPQGECDLGPVIKAAGSPDPSELRSVLERARGLRADDFISRVLKVAHIEPPPLQTPLLHAIEKQLPENIRMLLEAGCDPNGFAVDRDWHKYYERRFRRFTKPEDLRCGGLHVPSIFHDWNEVSPVSSQSIALTDEELKARRSSINNFWLQSTHPLGLALHTNGDVYHSLIKAAGTTISIFHQILDAGAECEFWKTEEKSTLLPEEDELTPSQLCISTPLHSAVASNNMEMLKAILDRGFNPDARALIVGCQAFTPMQFAILLGNVEAYHILSSYAANPDILTPVLGVHGAHLAAALLEIDLLEVIKTPLPKVPATALGHTLLHIACLPWKEKYVQKEASKIHESVHDTRALFPPRYGDRRTNMWSSIGGLIPKGEFKNVGEPMATLQTLEMRRMLQGLQKRYPDELEKQETMCEHLLSALGVEAIEAQDIYENTALHYLACVADFNAPLVDWLRSQGKGEEIWKTKRNLWGWTAEDLRADALEGKVRESAIPDDTCSEDNWWLWDSD